MKLEDYTVTKTVKRVLLTEKNQTEVVKWLDDLIDFTYLYQTSNEDKLSLIVKNKFTGFSLYVDYGDYIYLDEQGIPYAWKGES